MCVILTMTFWVSFYQCYFVIMAFWVPFCQTYYLFCQYGFLGAILSNLLSINSYNLLICGLIQFHVGGTVLRVGILDLKGWWLAFNIYF